MDKRTNSERLILTNTWQWFYHSQVQNYSACTYSLPFYLKALLAILSLTVQKGTWVEGAVSKMSVLNIEINYLKR